MRTDIAEEIRTGRVAQPPHSYITVPEAADMMGISVCTMRTLLNTGAIPSIRPVRQRRIMVRDVYKYMEKVSESGFHPAPRRKREWNPLKD